MKKQILASVMTITAISASAGPEYPAAPSDGTTDNYFGTIVADPYRPLENDTAANTLEWVAAQRALTEGYLSHIGFRDRLRREIQKFQNYRKTGLRWHGGDGNTYFFENSGLDNQSRLYRGEPVSKERTVFLDPNTLSDDGTVALTGVFMSPSGRYTAYTISRSGSDWTEIFVLDTATGELTGDHIEWAKFTGAEWNGDDGFFYSAYERPDSGKEYSNANENHRVYYHRIGTPQSSDTIAFEDPANPLHFHTAYVPKKQDLIFLMTGGQGFGEAIMLKSISDPRADWKIMQDNQDDNTSILKVKDGTIYFITSADAPNYRLMKTSVDNPSKENWVTLIPERKDAVLKDAVYVNDPVAGERLVALYDKDASSRMEIFDLNGNRTIDVKLPLIGSATLSSDKEDTEVNYSLTSFLVPRLNYSLNPADGTSTLLYGDTVEGFNADDYMTEEIFYPSADGTMVHAFVTRRKDLKPDGTNPVYLYGYGGFNIALPPSFSPNRLVWLENGGIYVQANLRGGSEYGDAWHEAGTKLKKLNVFNDFIAAAEYMIANGWTTPDRLVIEGGSNGGLLVGATVNMRPDLFAVAIPRVGVMDMMRYHLFTIGWNWASDYGTSADSPEMAAYLLNYSPLHNIGKTNKPYPAIMVTTADHDDRVVPAHSFKYAAALQAADTGDKAKIIRIDSKAGHGVGKPISKVIDEQADIYSFIFHNLGIEPETSVK